MTLMFAPVRCMPILRLAAATCLTLLLSSMAHAQETLLTNRVTEMRLAPDDTANVLRSLPDKTAVKQLERKGAWTRVQVVGADQNAAKATGKNSSATQTDTGWVRMMHLRGGVVVIETQPSSSGGGFFAGVNRFLGGTPRGSTQAQSATVGIRGLSPDELKTATPDEAALAKMNTYKADKPEAERYAKEAKLARADVPELDKFGSRK